MGKPDEVVTVTILAARDGTKHLGYRTDYVRDGHFNQLGSNRGNEAPSKRRTAVAMKTPFTSGVLLLTATLSAQSPASPTPRLPDGHPDLNGTWTAAVGGRGGALKLPDGSICVTNCADFLPPAPAPAGRGGGRGAAGPPPRNFPKYKPEYLAKVKELDDDQVKFDTALRCQPPGVPRIGPPAKIVQTAREVVFLYDDLNGPFFRVVPTDGRPHRPVSEGRTIWAIRSAGGRATHSWWKPRTSTNTWLIERRVYTKGPEGRGTLRRTGEKLDARATSYDPAVLVETVGGPCQEPADHPRSGDRRGPFGARIVISHTSSTALIMTM